MRNISIEKLEYISQILKTVSHPVRIRIIELLETHGKMSVNDLCLKLQDVEQSLLSHHLSKMKAHKILSSEKKGKFVYYHIKLNEVIGILNCIEKCPEI